MSYSHSIPTWNTLPGTHDVSRFTLPNGITVICRPNFSSPSIYLTGYLACGSLQEPLEKLGLANFVASSLMRGTKKRTFQQIYNELESIGASMGFSASVQTTGFSARALSEDLPTIIELLAQALRFPVFPQEQHQRVRSQLLTMLAMRAQDTGEMASLEFDRLLFPEHPYGRPVDGYPETVAAIDQSDIAAYHRQNYRPEGMVIVLVGGVEPKAALEMVEKHLGDWQNESNPIPATITIVEKPSHTIRSHYDIPGMSQTDLVMGTLGPARSSPDYIAAAIGNNILGQFGMMGRIGDVVREKAGLAYYASTSLNASMYMGSWEVSAGVNPANLQKAIDLIISEINRFVKEGVTATELADSKSNFVGRLPLMMESNAGVGAALVNIERYQLGLEYYQQYAAKVEKVIETDIIETARKYLDMNALVISSAGVTE